jgi:hypothetical protein
MCARITLMRSVSGRSMKDPPGPLAREDQPIETLAAHQPFGAVFFGADKFRAGAGGLGLGITGHVQLRGEVGNLGTDFAFEARPAMHEEGVHSYSWADGETFSHCAMPRLASGAKPVTKTGA